MALSHVMNLVSNSGLVGAAGGSGGGGGGGNLDSQVVTVGQQVTATGGGGLPSGTSTRRGFLISGAGGSIADGTSNIYSGASILQIQYIWDTYYPISGLNLTIAGANRANSGWTTLTIGSTPYLRTSANYYANVGGNTGWTWFGGDYDYNGSADPFSATGTTTTCVFT